MTVQATENKHKNSKGRLSGLLGGAKTIWAVAIGIGLIAMFGAFTLLGNATATQTYYVLGRPVPARTLITPDMLIPREAKVNQAPPTAFDQAAVSTGEVFSKYALSAGDVVSASNAGPLHRINADVPDTFVAASFDADPAAAVAGKIRTGDFIDLIATDQSSTGGPVSKVVMQHVLVLDVTVNPKSISESATSGQEGANAGTPGPESEAVRTGIPSVYTVAVSPEDAAKLALIRDKGLFVVLSGNLPEETLDARATTASVFDAPVGDSSEGTFASIFVMRWDVAFEPGNVYVDTDGTVWKVTSDKVWASDAGTLDAGDVPPGYLQPPSGADFTDAKGVYWVVDHFDSKSNSLVWYAPETKTLLKAGDYPEGYDPHAEFSDTATAPSAN